MQGKNGGPAKNLAKKQLRNGWAILFPYNMHPVSRVIAEKMAH